MAGTEEISTDAPTQDVDIFKWNSDLDLRINDVVVHLYIGENGELKGEVENVDLNINLPWKLPKSVVNTIVSWVAERVASRLSGIAVPSPEQMLGSSVLSSMAKVNVADILTHEGEMDISIDLNFPTEPRVESPLPRFIVNKDPASMIVHRAECVSLDTVSEKDRLGFFTLYDALDSGYRTCPRCFPDSP